MLGVGEVGALSQRGAHGGAGRVDAGGELPQARDEVAAEPPVDLDDDRTAGRQLDLGVGDAEAVADGAVRGPQHRQQFRIGAQRVVRGDVVADLLEVGEEADLFAGHEHRVVLAVHDGRVDADLGPFEILLDQRPAAVGDRSDPAGLVGGPERPGDLAGVRGEHDADAGAHAARLDDDRVADLLRRREGLLGGVHPGVPGLVDARLGEQPAAAVLVPAALHTVHARAGQAQCVRHVRGRHDQGLVPAQHAAHRDAPRQLPGGREHRVPVGEVHDRVPAEPGCLPAGLVVREQPDRVRRRGTGQQVLAVLAQPAPDEQDHALRALAVAVVVHALIAS